jgi:hypothetical protein
VIATAEDDTFSVDEIDEARVAFCTAPKAAAKTPVRVTMLENIVCVALAKPGGLGVQATAPAAGLYEPGLHSWQLRLEELRKKPGRHKQVCEP